MKASLDLNRRELMKTSVTPRAVNRLLALASMPLWFYAVINTNENLSFLTRFILLLIPVGLFFYPYLFGYIEKNSDKWGWKKESHATEICFDRFMFIINICSFLGVIRYLSTIG